MIQHLSDKRADGLHLGSTHTSRCHRRAADADTAGDPRPFGIKRDAVFIDGDTDLSERFLSRLTGNIEIGQVHKYHMVIRTPRHQPDAGSGQACGKGFGIVDSGLLIHLERIGECFFEGNGLGADRHASAGRPGCREISPC